MKTELYTISKIFTERLLRIPDYQRGYAWTDKQLKEFWCDIQQIEHGCNHYVGVLTLEDVSPQQHSFWKDDEWIIRSKKYEPYYIVDGQQRLTTTIILVQCILESIGDHEINYTKPEEIRKKFIFESKDSGISRSYLFGYEVDNPSYEFLKQKIFLEKSDNQGDMQETIYTNNLLRAKLFFSEKLKSLSLEEIETIYTKVTQNLLFNIYSMSDEIDVHVSFETMNNRGKPLSHLELLKNRLIYLSTKVDKDEFEKRKLRDAINECWKTIYHQLGRNKDNPLDDDTFLFNHFILFFGKDFNDINFNVFRYQNRINNVEYKEYLLEEKFTTKSLYLDNDSRLTLDELYRYVSSMKSSVEKWYEISNPKGSSLDSDVAKWLEKINRMKTDVCLPLIMVVLQKTTDTNTQVKFLKSLEKNLFCNQIFKISYRFAFNVDYAMFIKLAGQLSNDEISLEKIITKLDDFHRNFLADGVAMKQLLTDFKERGFYNWCGLRYFMYEYEQHLKEKSKSYTDKLSWSTLADDARDHRTIEHIYPQNTKRTEWTELYKHYSVKERKILRHTIGNLVPLSKSKNSSFQNKPFLHKVGNSSSGVGFKYGSFSEIEISENQQWTAVEILKRSVHLIKFMEKRWGFDFGGVDKIINFVSLDFVLKHENLTISGRDIVSI